MYIIFHSNGNFNNLEFLVSSWIICLIFAGNVVIKDKVKILWRSLGHNRNASRGRQQAQSVLTRGSDCKSGQIDRKSVTGRGESHPRDSTENEKSAVLLGLGASCT